VTPQGLAYLATLSRLEFLNLSQMSKEVLSALPTLRLLPLQNLRVARMCDGFPGYSLPPTLDIGELLKWLPTELRPAVLRAHPVTWESEGAIEEDESYPWVTPAEAHRLMLPACKMPSQMHFCGT
jgi:hypothetical protein